MPASVLQVTHFHHSVVATKALRDAQKVDKPLNLIQDVATRWNSQLYMIQRILRLKLAIITVMHDVHIIKPTEKTLLQLNDNNWRVCRILVQLGSINFNKEVVDKLITRQLCLTCNVRPPEWQHTCFNFTTLHTELDN